MKWFQNVPLNNGRRWLPSTNWITRNQTHSKSPRPVCYSPPRSSRSVVEIPLAISVAILRREFLQEESDARKRGVTFLHKTTPTTFLRQALDVEERQYVCPFPTAPTALIHSKGGIYGRATVELPQAPFTSKSPSMTNENPLHKRLKSCAPPNVFISQGVLSTWTT